jgi:hypothetical protein
MVSKLKPFYQNILQDEAINRKLVLVLEKNPREIKRFLNSFIMKNEVYFENQEEAAIKYVWVFLLEWKWPEIHTRFTDETNSIFRAEIKKARDMDSEDRKTLFITKKEPTPNDPRKIDFVNADIIEKLLSEDTFWEFINHDRKPTF